MSTPNVDKVIHIAYFKRQLESRLLQLNLAIGERLAGLRDGPAASCASEVHERAEEFSADNLSEVGAAELERELQELRNVRVALRRIKLGTYGTCLDCGLPIVRERLTAQLTAQRCLSCQEAYDGRLSSTRR